MAMSLAKEAGRPVEEGGHEMALLTGDPGMLKSALGPELVALLESHGVNFEGGDTRLTWDADNADEVEAARRTFAMLTGKGHQAFQVGRKGEKTDKVVREFDPNAEKLILAPAIRGG